MHLLSKILRITSFLFLLLPTSKSFAGWTTVASGINDNLKSMNCWGNNAVVVGNHGIYYSTTGISTSWTKFVITGNSSDSLRLTQCRFSKVTSKVAQSDKPYFCGQDTVNKTAIVFFLDLTTFNYSFIYTGPVNSNITDMCSDYSTPSNIPNLYCVGDSGFFVYARNFANFTIVSTGTTKNFKAIYTKNLGYIEIVGDEVYYKGHDNGSTITFNGYYFPGIFFTDIEGDDFIANTSIAIGNGKAYKFNYAVPTEITNYDFGPLNATSCAFWHLGNAHVATDHGIYTGDTYYNYLEYSPSSNATHLNEVRFVSAQSGFAVGNNGIILFTNDTGTPLKPYCNISAGGGCTGATISLNSFISNATNCQWYIDSVPVSNFVTYSHTFPTAGIYHATFHVWTPGALDDTSYATFYVVDTPQINLPITLADSILCHAQPISLQIHNTESDASYSLFLTGNSIPFATAAGNGGAISLNTAPVNTAGVYHLRASNILAPGCAVNFTDSFFVNDEHTTALFHVGFINSNVGESVQFYSKSLEAQQFHWTFSNNTQSITSNVENPSGIIFTDTGYVNVMLIAISTNGCADTIIDNGNYVSNEPTWDDTCWSNYTDGIDPNWQGHSAPAAVRTIVPAINGGFFISGGCDRHILRTRFGVPFGRTANAGGYIAKYSKNGMLKWIEYSYNHYYSAGTTFASSPAIPAIDGLGNIFIADAVASSGTGFIYNNGDTMQYTNSPQGYAIVKLDSMGVPVWNTFLDGGSISKIVFDASGNLVMTGTVNYNTTILKYYFNGILTDSLITTSMVDTKEFVMRLDSSGHCLWMTLIENNFTNYAGINDFTVDHQNNICMAGVFEHDVTFHSTNNTTAMLVNTGWSMYGGKMYLVKYDSNGILIWKMSAGCSTYTDGTMPFAILSDANNNFYMSGLNTINTSNHATMTCINSDSTIYTTTLGSYFLQKVNASGHVVWTAGLDGTSNCYVMAITMHNDKIYAAGNITNNQGLWSGNFISSNGMATPYSLARYDFFLARYDTTGVLEQLGNSATNQTQTTHELGLNTICITSTGKLFMAGNASIVSTIVTPVLFGDSLFFNGGDGFYAKTDLDLCGNLIAVSSENQLGESHTLSLFPNPAHNYITISTDQNKIKEVAIYDLCGKELMRKKCDQESNLVIDLSSLSTGMHVVKIVCEGGEVVRRVVRM